MNALQCQDPLRGATRDGGAKAALGGDQHRNASGGVLLEFSLQVVVVDGYAPMSKD